MSKKKDAGQGLSGDQKFQLWLMLVDRVCSIVMFALKVVATIAIVWGVVELITALSGKVTEANVNLSVQGEGELWVRVLAGFEQECLWAWVVTVIFLVYGLFERELRRRKTAYLQGRIIKLEKEIDPHRGSSGLTIRGETNPGDKV